MIAANRNPEEQTKKVVNIIDKVLDRIHKGRCTGGMANYLIKAIVGGILNYHALFTRLSQKGEIATMDSKIRKIMRTKGGVSPTIRLGMLYDKTGMGMGWFSARTCVNEVVLTEGWIALTSETLEGDMLRDQMAPYCKRQQR